MGLINVELEGLPSSRLMIHSALGMIPKDTDEKDKVTASLHKKVKLSGEQQAEAVAYRMKSGNLFIPSSAVKGAMLNASKLRKINGKVSLKPLIAGGVVVLPHEIDLGTKKYDIDVRTGVNHNTFPASRIIIYRPKLDKWRARFQIRFNDEIFKDASFVDLIKLCLTDAGLRIGLLSFRPEKGGECGCYKVNRFDIIEAEYLNQKATKKEK